MARGGVIGALRVTLGIDTAAFEQGLDQLEKRLSKVGKDMQRLGKTLSTRISAPLALAGGAGLKMAADFEAAMSRVKAVLRPTEGEFKSLSAMAAELGRTTQFTATQAADGIEMLARNGLKAGDILTGAAEATLNLAAAAGAELAPAADVMTDIMVNFNRTGAELVGTVDNIAGTLVNSKLGWDDYAAAVGQAAGAAGPLGMSFEDMNAALAATAPSFASGEEAGTSFKGMLLRLAPSEKKAQELIKQLGLEFFDAAGNMKPLADIAEELRLRLGHLTKQAQTEVLGALFGQRTIRTALRLMEEGREGIERIKASIADVSAAEMAKDRLDNLKGSFLLLRSAVEGLAITIANAGLLEWTRSLVEGLTEIVGSLNAVNPTILKFGTIVAGLALAIGPVILALGLFASAIAVIGAPVALAIAAIVAITAAVAAFWPDIKEAARIISNSFRHIYDSARLWLEDKLKPLFKAIGWAARQLGIELKGVFADATADLVEKAAKGGGLGGLRAEFARTAEEARLAAQETIGPWLTATNRFKEEIKGTGTLTNTLKSDLDEIVSSPLHTLAEKMAAVEQAFRNGVIPIEEYRSRIRQLREEEFRMLSEEARAALDDIIYAPTETFTTKMDALTEALRRGTIGFREFGQAVARVHDENIGHVKDLASATASALTQIFAKSKAAGIAAALINTAVAVTNALKLPFPFNWAQAALVAASGAAQVAAIKSTSNSGGGRTPSVSGAGGGGESGPAQAAPPSQTLTVAGISPSQIFSGEAVRSLVEQLLQYQRDGGRVVLA